MKANLKTKFTLIIGVFYDGTVRNYDRYNLDEIIKDTNLIFKDFDAYANIDYIDTNESEELKSFDELVYEDFEKKLNNYNDDMDDINNTEDEEIKKIISSINLAALPVPLEQAVQDYQDGERDAFDYIFNHYKPKLERLGYRMHDDDLAQELSIILLKATETFDITCGAKFNTYYWKCARNHMGTLNLRKNAKKRTPEHGIVSLQQSFSSNDSDVQLEAFVEDKADEENNIEKRMFHLVLENEVYPYLKDDEILAIKMLLQKYTLEQIGKALGNITAPAVHVKFRRLKDKKHVGKHLKILYETYCS
jgi:RNA polymerase sigma factor (sigma-70 family)